MKPTANAVLDGEKTESFYSHIRNYLRVLEVPASAGKQEKEIESKQIGKDGIKPKFSKLNRNELKMDHGLLCKK